MIEMIEMIEKFERSLQHCKSQQVEASGRKRKRVSMSPGSCFDGSSATSHSWIEGSFCFSMKPRRRVIFIESCSSTVYYFSAYHWYHRTSGFDTNQTQGIEKNLRPQRAVHDILFIIILLLFYIFGLMNVHDMMLTSRISRQSFLSFPATG